ncbi:MAG: insulinase family protein [Candidatus Eremiobacteraeota bacterium]|nr:insulinase family protein [Candidatus Eremiobacteraeota bacterium]
MKRFLAGILAGLFLFPQIAIAQVAPSPASSASDSEANVVQATLANGMRVVLLPNKLAPVVTTLMTYGVGSDDDTMPGLAHATEHMLFRGTRELSAGQLADITARIGAQYNAQTANEYTLYYFKLPSAYVDVALHIEADRMTHAAIRATDWETERGAIKQEILAQQSVPSYAIGVKLRESFFRGTPFANASGGTVPSFNLMTSGDIRRFYEAWYHPSNATLIVAGDIDAQRTLTQIHGLFDPIPASALPTRAAIAIPALTNSTIRNSMDFPVGIGAFGYRLPGSHDPDYAAAQVLAQVFQSRRGALADLSAEGKTLAVFSTASAYPEIGVAFLAAIPVQGATPESAQTLLRGVLDGYRLSGIPSELIDAARTALLSEQAFRRASISGLGFTWAETSAQRLSSPDAVYASIERVTKDDVDRVFRTYLTPEHQVSLIILPKPKSTMPKVAPGSGAEDVSFTPSAHEVLPQWARIALGAPLRAPADETGIMARIMPNGIRLTMRRETTSPTVSLSGVIRTDPQLYAPQGKDGVSLLVQSLLSFGTTTYDRKTYEAELEKIAAQISTGTSFALKIQSKDIDRGMQLLADGMLHPAFAPATFSIVKTRVQQSVAAQNQLPKTKADLAERLALYPPSDPRRRDVTEKTIANINLNDVKRYYRFAYRPDETSIAIVGDITPSRAQSLVQKYFGGWHAIGQRPTFEYPKIKTSFSKPATVTIKSAVNQQSEVTLKQLFTMRRSDADYVPMLLANIVLSGEGASSLLFDSLRTHYGYVYSVDSDVSVTQHGAEFTISYSADPRNVERAGAAAVAIVKRLQTAPLPLVELQRGKALLLAQRVLPLDSYDGIAAEFLAGAGEGYYTGGSDRWFWKALLDTTPAQLQHAMRRIDARRFLRVIVAPGA